MHDRLPTDEKLQDRGSNLASICSICLNSEETTSHLFFQCPFALKLWTWLANLLNINLPAIDNIWKIGEQFTPQCRLVSKVAVINTISIIWYSRNQARFQDEQIHWRSAINSIISYTSISGNNTKLCSRINMTEFVFLKAFNINIHPPRAPVIKEVIWNPPNFHWLKVNTDGALVKNPINTAMGVLLRTFWTALLPSLLNYMLS